MNTLMKKPEFKIEIIRTTEDLIRASVTDVYKVILYVDGKIEHKYYAGESRLRAGELATQLEAFTKYYTEDK